MSEGWTRILSMDREYLRREHPRVAALLDSSSAAQVAAAAERAVTLALAATGLEDLAREPEAVRRVVGRLRSRQYRKGLSWAKMWRWDCCVTTSSQKPTSRRRQRSTG